MASDWQAFKRSWSNKQEPLTLCVALRAVHAFTSRSLGPRMAKVSWKRIGIEADQPLNRDMLFVNRASEIFSTVREKQQPQPQSAALSIFKEVSPKKAKCKGKGCGQLLSSNMKICFNCGLQNPEPILLSRICVLRSAKASLSLWFRKEVIDSGLLETKDKRRQFLQTWKANRATRFCKGPQEIWAKKG